MPLRAGDKYDVAQIDIFHSSLVVNLNDKTSCEVKIKNCWDLRFTLLGLKVGDMFNIKGLGKIKVLSIKQYDRSDEYDLSFYERVFFCRKIEAWNNNAVTSLVPLSNPKERLQEFLRENFARTWGRDEPYVE